MQVHLFPPLIAAKICEETTEPSFYSKMSDTDCAHVTGVTCYSNVCFRLQRRRKI